MLDAIAVAKHLKPEQRAALQHVVANPGPQREGVDLNACVVLRSVHRLLTGGWHEGERVHRFYPTSLGREVAAIIDQTPTTEPWPGPFRGFRIRFPNGDDKQ